MAILNLGVCSTSTGLQRIKLPNIDLETNVKIFRNQALQVIKTIQGDIEFYYCGLILEDENTLSSYGITDGATIHALAKLQSQPTVSINKMSASDLINGFRTLVLFPNYRYASQRLARPDVIDTILKACPGLYDDPAALALIQDPELIFYLSNHESATEMIEKHPILLEAGSHILAQVHDEQANLNPNVATTSTGYSYSLDALSDDDEEMDSNSDNTFSQNPLTRNASFNAITAAQLAAAIANATNTQFNTNSAGVPNDSGSASNIITSEMFSNAIQQAIGLGGNRGNNRANEDSFEVLSNQWAAQLKQMHEMGLLDDTVNIRSLRAVNGDVNAAIELVLSLNEMQ